MESRISALTANIEQEFNTISFEKKLLQLKDSQESINTLSAWCLDNRHHHKKIVNAWLNVLKKVKVEQRLTLFYLANDVIQYSKRKNYDFVGSWGTTLQKATTMVREEKVKNKILRIFKIWEQRGIYGEEFIADLCGLISASPMGRHPDLEPQEFQPSYLITRIRSCAKLEENTDLKLKLLKENGPKITDSDALLTSLKDRQHVEDVERDVEEGITLIEGYVNALKAEIKSRTHLIAVLTQAEAFYHTERGEVKVVNMAYRTFTTKVKNVKRKLDELIPTLGSPIPSPDINAPSPEPDSDMELPNLDMNSSTNLNHSTYNLSTSSSIYPVTDTYSAGYYNPVQSQETQSQQNFNNSSFSSFMNSSNGPFNMQDTTNNIYPDQRQDDIYSAQPASHEMSHHHNLVQHDTLDVKISYDYGHQSQTPLLPPPMPPFTSSGYMDSYSDNNYVTADSYATSTNYQTVDSNSYTVTSDIQASYIPTTDAYNPEEEVETWEPEATWEAPADLETPESPPIYEKEGFADPIEYDDSKIEMGLGEKDVDHRILLPPPIPPQLSDHRLPRSNSKDVDHRNLISLTGSPANDIRSPSPPQSLLPPPPAPPSLWSNSDQDYRSQDQDYRIPTIDSSIKQSSIKSSLIQIPAVETPIKPVNNNQNIVDFAQQLQLPPPPPPPPPIGKTSIKSAKKYHDNVESIDMDLSDDESSQKNCADTQPNSLVTQNNHRSDVFVNNRTCGNKEQSMLEPPPPIPQNLCDLPDISEDLPFDEDIMTGKDENEDTVEHMENHPMNMPPPVPENMMGAGHIPFIPPGNMPPNNMPPPGSIPPGNMPPGNISSGNMPPHNMPPGGMPPGNMPPGMPHGGMPGPLPPGGMPPGGMSLGGMPPPPPHMGDRPGGMGWSEDWFDGRPPPPDIHNRPPFHPMFAKRHPNDFRGGFRGRGDEHGMEIFRGRGRARGFRGMRGMNNWGPNRGFIARGHRGFRGHFRGGF